jgi:hypothetical protein
VSRLHHLLTRAGVLVALLLAACGADPTAAPRPTGIFPTLTGAPVRLTLPPTWTPSATPSGTPSRTPTLTPTPVSTESAEAICAGLRLLYDFTGRESYPWSGYIPIFASLESRSSWLRFRVTHRISGAGTGFELPGGQAVGVEFRIDALPRPGTYDWVLDVRSEAHGAICTRTGSFIALRPTATPTPAPVATPDN